ncbi:hypothetical protein [Falsiroseomonas sp. HW251]|uniref:hypothetical protein n=1 Tax=Falsiroseomonas sp. HW251 TaxID=3390998 RepID=UPI003D313FCB
MTRRIALAALLGAASLAAAAPASAQGYRNPGADGTWAERSWVNPYTGGAFNNGTSMLLDVMRNNQQRLDAIARPGSRAGGVMPQASAASSDPSFRLTNRASISIARIFVSPSQVDDWGADRLGTAVLGAGQSLIIHLPAGLCVNDVRVVFATGQTLERRRVNTCALTDMAFP